MDAHERSTLVQLREVHTTITASAAERAAVAELMSPIEQPFGQPSLDVTMEIILLSPAEPVDDPDDE